MTWGKSGEDAFPHRGRQGCTAVGDGEQAGQVVIAVLDLLDQWPGDRVADHRDGQHPFAFGQPQDVGRAQPLDIVGGITMRPPIVMAL